MAKEDMIINPITGEIDLDLHRIVKGFSKGGQSLCTYCDITHTHARSMANFVLHLVFDVRFCKHTHEHSFHLQRRHGRHPLHQAICT